MTISKVMSVAALVGLVLCPAPAWAHARLTRSEPASGSRVGSPQIIRLWFSERPEVALTGVTVTNGSGSVFAAGVPQPNSGDPLEVSFAVSASLPSGEYKVAWRTVASDGHPSRGSFTFVVLSTPAPAATDS